MKIILWLLTLYSLLACKPTVSSEQISPSELSLKISDLVPGSYAFDKPDAIYVLDADLSEISGLEYDPIKKLPDNS